MLRRLALFGRKRTRVESATGTIYRSPGSILNVWPGNREEVQNIGVVDIDPAKLMKKLREKFGTDFKVHVRASCPPPNILPSADLGYCR